MNFENCRQAMTLQRKDALIQINRLISRKLKRSYPEVFRATSTSWTRAEWRRWRRRDQTAGDLSRSHRSFLCDLLEGRSQNSRFGVSINRVIGAPIVISVGATILESVPRLRVQYGDLFKGVEISERMPEE